MADVKVEQALKAAIQFIENGVEYGYIRMPDSDTPDSAHDTLPMLKSTLAALATGRDDKLAGDDDPWSDRVCALVDAAFETVSRNPSDHEQALAYRRAILAVYHRAIIEAEAIAQAIRALKGSK